MAKTFEQYTGDGVRTVYPVDFVLGYLEQDDIYIYKGDDYNTQLSYTWQNSTTIELDTPVVNGTTFRIRRIVDRSELINSYSNGARLGKNNLNQSFLQTLMLVEEIDDGFISADNTVIPEDMSLAGNKITDVGECIEDSDAANKKYVDDNDALKVSKAGDSMSGDLSMGSNQITGLARATQTSHAVNLEQVLEYLTGAGVDGVVPTVQPRQVGDGTTTVFSTPTIGVADASPNSFFVSVDGVTQRPTLDFIITAGGYLQFVQDGTPDAPAVNTKIDITYFNPISLGDLSTAAITATGTTTPRTLGDRFGDVVSPADNGADGSGIADSHVQIQETINDFKYIDLKGQIFRSDSVLTVPTGKQVVVKNGTLDLSNVVGDNLDLISQEGIGYTDQVNTTANIAYPDTIIPVLDGSAYSAKDVIQIKSTGQWSKNTTQSEFAVISSVSGNNITLHGCVLGDYKTSDSAYIRKVDTTTGLVLQDVTVIGNPSYSQNGVVLNRCAYSGYSNIHFINCTRACYEVANSVFVTGSGDAIFEHTDLEGLGYGLLTPGSQWCNFGDVIGNNCRHVTTTGDSSGSEALARWQTYGNIIGNGCRDAISDTHDGACDFTYVSISGTLKYGNGADDGVTMEGARIQIGSINISNVERFGINVNYGGLGDTGRLSFVQIGSAAIEGKVSGDYAVLVKTDTGTTSSKLDMFSIGNLVCNSERGVYVEALNADIGTVDINGHIKSVTDHTVEVLSSATYRVERLKLSGEVGHSSTLTSHYPVFANGTTWSANNANAVTTQVDLNALLINNTGVAVVPIRVDSCKAVVSNLTLGGTYATGNSISNGVGSVHFNDSQYGKHKFAYNPSNVATGNSTSTTVNIPSLNFGDFIQVAWDEPTFGLYVYGFISAASTVTVVFRNDTGGDVNLNPGNINVSVSLG